MINLSKLDPQASIVGTHGLTIGDFWAWAYSDILSNASRGVFAEFLVGSALGVVEFPRVEWDWVDLLYRGKRIEVKSSAYCQSWEQRSPSMIIFNIAESRGWDSTTNTYLAAPQRSSDCYVFCVYTEVDCLKARASLFNVDYWKFYATATSQLNEKFGRQKSLSLKSLQSISEPIPYIRLKDVIDTIFEFL